VRRIGARRAGAMIVAAVTRVPRICVRRGAAAARLRFHAALLARADETPPVDACSCARGDGVHCSATSMSIASRRRSWSLLVKLALGSCVQPALFALLLFGPVGTFAWPRAWVLIATVAVATVVSVVVLARVDTGLLAERMKPPLQRGQPLADKIFVSVFLLAYLAAIAFVPLDVFALRLLPPPPPALSAAGLVVFLAGWLIVTAAMRANAFAAPVVKHQAERGQRVVDTGPYAVVRHPMYAGAVLLMIAVPLWLESTAGTLFALVPALLLMVRIAIEEAFLRRQLAGYDAYTTRVRWRLVPGVW
jgi:protein-S-isoprenylcysteine O-methyltransferase Ste14